MVTINVRVFLSLLVSVLIAGLSGCTTPFPYDDYDYTVDSLELGIAFPPVGNAEQLQFTIGAMTSLNMTMIRFSQTWSLREPENDAWNWAPLAARVAKLGAAEKEIFLSLELKEFPDWTHGLSLDELKSEFREYISLLLSLYGENLSYIQYGNEWNWEIDQFRSGDDAEYIALANILYEEVQALSADRRPTVVLGSLSIGALRGIAFAQDRIDNVSFQGEELYGEDDLAEADVALVDEVPRMRDIISEVKFDAVDLHFYDDVWNWSIYMDAFTQLVSQAGKNLDGIPIVVSEFGGPHPELEPKNQNYRAAQLVEYVRTLDALPVELALYFKLVESSGPYIVHSNSYLYDRNLRSTPSFEVMRRFAGGRKTSGTQ